MRYHALTPGTDVRVQKIPDWLVPARDFPLLSQGEWATPVRGGADSWLLTFI